MASSAVAASAVLVFLGALGGCSDGGPRGVLTEDDLSGVSSVADTSDGLGTARCARLSIAELKIRLDNGSDDRERRFILRDGEIVGSSANGVARRFDDAADALTTVDAAIDYCSSRDPLPGTTIERLAGLPAGAVGYRLTYVGGASDEVLTRVFAPHGDEVVIVSTQRTGDDPPVVDAVDLLPTALVRAAELD